jgi:ATP-dependent DNA ligase
MKPLYKRNGDKPFQRKEIALSQLDDGKHTCEPKIDGWRAQIHQIQEKLVVFSASWQELPVSQEVLEGFPLIGHGTVWDCEWVRRRACKNEAIVLFSPLFVKSKWVGNLIHDERRKMLEDMVPDKFVVPSYNTNFVSVYQDCKKSPDMYEGVVIKDRKSTMKGSPKSRAKNGMWTKVKFRA